MGPHIQGRKTVPLYCNTNRRASEPSRPQFVTVPFTNVVDFFDSSDAEFVARACVCVRVCVSFGNGDLRLKFSIFPLIL